MKSKKPSPLSPQSLRIDPPRSADNPGLPWPPLTKGILLKRYKRFLADVRLEDGSITTIHCPNSGSMKTCCEPGSPVYCSTSANPKRKYRHTWELIEMPDSLVGVNTAIPNRLVAFAASHGQIPKLAGYETIKPEIQVSPDTRLDLLLSTGDERRCYVEVKNCTQVEDGMASFPDAVTTRGQKHLRHLIDLVAQGHRGVIFFLIQRMDAREFSPADHIDPAYGKGLREACAAGVEALAYDVHINLEQIRIRSALPIVL